MGKKFLSFLLLTIKRDSRTGEGREADWKRETTKRRVFERMHPGEKWLREGTMGGQRN